MLNPQKLRQLSVCVLLAVFAAPMSTTLAAAEKFRVNLIATIDDDPALENVEWVVMRGDEEVRKARKHSTHVNIPRGSYTVVARLSSNKSVVRSRNVQVRHDTQVVVPMDH